MADHSVASLVALMLKSISPLLPAACFVKRFNAAVDDARKPTTDVSHPAVVNLGLNNLGPYVFSPMYGTWTYTINSPGGPGKSLGVSLQQMLKDRDPAVEYDLEKIAAKPGPFNWKNPATNANFAFYRAGVTAGRQGQTRPQSQKARTSRPPSRIRRQEGGVSHAR
jgi:hypothetical protein